MVKLLHYYIFLRTSDLIYLQNFYIFLNSKWYYGEGRGGGGVQAYNFGNFEFEIWVEEEGQDFLGWFCVHAHNFTHVRPRSKNGTKHKITHSLNH